MGALLERMYPNQVTWPCTEASERALPWEDAGTRLERRLGRASVRRNFDVLKAHSTLFHSSI